MATIPIWLKHLKIFFMRTKKAFHLRSGTEHRGWEIYQMGCVKQKVAFEHAQNDSDHLGHKQSIIRAFAHHSFIQYYPVILLVGREGSDQTAWMCRQIWAVPVCICQRTHFCTWLHACTAKIGSVGEPRLNSRLFYVKVKFAYYVYICMRKMLRKKKFLKMY